MKGRAKSLEELKSLESKSLSTFPTSGNKTASENLKDNGLEVI
jgi:hypothetical protein